MNIFGVSPLELIIIAVLGLVIFGPERLPGIGRSLGRMVARVLAWQYTSPEAQLFNELRADLQREISEIRDEMIRARQQLDIRQELQEIRQETEDAIRSRMVPGGSTAAANGTTASAVEPALTTEPDATPADASTPKPENAGATTEPANGRLEAHDEPEPSIAPPAEPAYASYAPPATSEEVELLRLQIQALMSDMRALQEQLRQHNLIDSDWQPPSHAMQQEEQTI
jgi:sec-independent protein translocase protein TatB